MRCLLQHLTLSLLFVLAGAFSGGFAQSPIEAGTTEPNSTQPAHFPSEAAKQQVGPAPAIPKRVLVLYWYNKDYPLNVRFERSFINALESPDGTRFEYYPEYLESNRFPGEIQSRLLHDYLRQKYLGLNIDVVVANSDATLEFLLKYRSDLFPNTPILFESVSTPALESLTAGPGMTGILAIRTHRQTLDLALRL